MGVLNAANEKRNGLIHGSWAAGGAPGTSTLFKITAKEKGFDIKFQPVKAEDLDAITDEICTVNYELERLMLKLLGGVELPEEQPDRSG